MAQRYTNPLCLVRMAEGKCPECCRRPAAHLSITSPWVPRLCDLRPDGVTDRIAQYQRDVAEAADLRCGPCRDRCDRSVGCTCGSMR